MKKINIFLITLIILSTRLISQEIQATVVINTESLPVQHRELLTAFKGVVEDYINKNRWTEYTWSTNKIPIQFNIFFKTVSGVDKYSAQVAITSQREIYNSTKISPLLRMMDNSWEFNFDKNQILYLNPNVFEPLTSFLNYYVNVVLGLYFDTFQPLGGNKYFNQALSLANLGANSSYAIGWTKGEGTYSRQEFMSEMINEKYQEFRKAIYEYHYNGLDLISENKDAVMDGIKKIVPIVEDIRAQVFLKSLTLRIFFDTKYQEISEIIFNANEKKYFDRLKKIDPSHFSTYDEFNKKNK